MKLSLTSSALFAALGLAAAPAAQTLNDQLLASGFSSPVWVGAPAGDDRIFVAEQGGEIKVFEEGSPATLFLDLDPLVLSGGEQGLLGVAFHPKFAQNGYFFVNYTQNGNGNTIIARYQVSGDPDVADPGSAVVFLETGQPFSNHNAGDLAFSPVDGYLYIPIGDGGSGNDPKCRAQNFKNLKGTLMRIDVDTPDPVAGTEYSIPADNPFANDFSGDVRRETWSYGLRNPYRFSFDQLTGDIYIGDVGQNSREEISFEPALAASSGTATNYGWPVMEADECNNAGVNNCTNEGVAFAPCFDASYTDPIHAYDLYVNGRCSVVGGVVYRGCQIPALQGTYIFADYCGNDYWRFDYDGVSTNNFQDITSQLVSAGNNPTDIGEDGHGELLIVTHNGRVSRIVAATAPTITDCDANGLDDDCEVSTVAWADLDGNGTVDACQSFSADTDHVCVALGGTQNWNLHAGAGHANEFYLVMGSFGGTSPGLPFGAFNLPLNFDFYLPLTIELANNGAPFVLNFGALDIAGDASAAFSAPAGLLPASVVGLTAAHAYATFDLGGGVSSTSNYTTLEFRP